MMMNAASRVILVCGLLIIFVLSISTTPPYLQKLFHGVQKNVSSLNLHPVDEADVSKEVLYDTSSRQLKCCETPGQTASMKNFYVRDNNLYTVDGDVLIKENVYVRRDNDVVRVFTAPSSYLSFSNNIGVWGPEQDATLFRGFQF